MKRVFYFALIFLTSITIAKAQKPITLSPDSVKFGSRYYPGFWLGIPEARPADVKADWIKAIEKGTKSKVTTDRNEMTLFGALLPNFTKGSVNIMSKIAEKDSLSLLFVSVETSRDNFVNTNSEEYAALSKYLNKFGKTQYTTTAKKQLAAEESKLQDLEKELKATRKNKEKLEKNIQSAQVKITGQNDKIKSIEQELSTLDIKIGNASTALSVIEDGDAKKAKKSELKSLQKTKKSLLNDSNAAQSKITKANTSIADSKNEIKINLVSQQELADKIAQQKLNVSKYQQKLKNIEAL